MHISCGFTNRVLSNFPSLLKYMVVSRKFIVLDDFSAVNFIVGKHWLQWSKKLEHLVEYDYLYQLWYTAV